VKEHFAHNTLKGDVSLEGSKRPPMKIYQLPRIVACVPIGTKDQFSKFKTPDGTEWQAPSVAVPGVLPAAWLVSQMALVPPLSMAMHYIFRWGMLSGEARQILTTRALETVQEDGYILYWDDDVLVPPMGLFQLYNFMETHPEAGLVTAVYSTRTSPTEPLIYKDWMKGAYWGLTVGPAAEPEEIFGAGAGFMLARVKAVKELIANNPGVPIWADSKSIPTEPGEQGHNWGHDMRFCRLMHEAGWKVFVDGRVECAHYDAASQTEYKLPEDSPPKVRGRARPAYTDPTIALVLPTYGHLDYAAKTAQSFRENTKDLPTVIIAVDDASPGVTAEEYAAWAKGLGIEHAYRFEQNGGLTRSWNYGLDIARSLGVEYTVCGNSDLIFSPSWDRGVLTALQDHDLVGPVTNAPGFGTKRQRVECLTDSEADIAWAADAAADRPAETLPTRPMLGATNDGQTVALLPEILNGFCLAARTKTWFAGAFDSKHVFDPGHPMTENELELQIRWGFAGRKTAVAASSFVFHYRGVSRGLVGLSDGAFRPETADALPGA